MEQVFFKGLQMREAEDGKGRIIEGYAVLFGVKSNVLMEDGVHGYREVMERGSITQELLDSMDFRLTMYHDREKILARSDKGAGTLNYQVSPQGVRFWALMPDTMDGRTAIELVKRGDISGCSFCYSTDEADDNCVAWEKLPDGSILRRVKKVTNIFDFTLAASPAYPQTFVSNREKGEGAQPLTPEQRMEKQKNVSKFDDIIGKKGTTYKTRAQRKADEVERLRSLSEGAL